MAKQRDLWARVNSGMPDHRKSRSLARELERRTGAKVERPWALFVALILWAIRNRYLDGRLIDCEPEDLAAAAEWEGDPAVLVAALEAVGWLHREDLHGTWTLHEWDLYHEKAAKQAERDREEARERMRLRRALDRLGEPGTPGAAGTPAAASPAGTPAAVEALPDGGCSVDCSGEHPRARASSRFVSSRRVDGGRGEGTAAGTLAAALDEAADLAEFAAWWSDYPPTPRRPSNRAKAWREWKATRGRRPETESMRRRLVVQKASPGWRVKDGLYIPLAHNYLRDERWDEVTDPGPAAAVDGGGTVPGVAVPVLGAERTLALASALPAPFAERFAPLVRAAGETPGPPDVIEARLAAIQEDLDAAAELALSDDESQEVERRVAARLARAAITGEQRDSVRLNLRRRAIRQLRRLPTLSLFAPEAQRGAA